MLIYSKEIYKQIENDLGKKTTQKNLHLAVIVSKDDFSTNVYIKKKKQFAKKNGFQINVINCTGASEEKIIQTIKECNDDKNIDGIIMQLPLNEKHNEQKILRTINVKKDVDVLNPDNPKDVFIPCVLQSILWILESKNRNFENKTLVYGSGKLVGTPIMDYLRKQNLSFVNVNKGEMPTLEDLNNAKVIVVGINGRVEIDSTLLRDDVIIFDAGSQFINNKYCGSVVLKNSDNFKGLITANPGGIGPLTVAALFNNLIKCSNIYITKTDFLQYFTSCKNIVGLRWNQIQEYGLFSNKLDNEDEIEVDADPIGTQDIEFGEINPDFPMPIIEGMIVGKKFIDFIKNEHLGRRNINFYDLSKLGSKNAIDKTNQLIKGKDDFCVFEAYFKINGCVMRPDALYRIDNKWTLIECKGVTKTKKLYYLDTLYQYQILKKMGIQINKVYLAYAKKTGLKKNGIEFQLNEYSSLAKSGSKILPSMKIIDIFKGGVPTTYQDGKKMPTRLHLPGYLLKDENFWAVVPKVARTKKTKEQFKDLPSVLEAGKFCKEEWENCRYYYPCRDSYLNKTNEYLDICGHLLKFQNIYFERTKNFCEDKKRNEILISEIKNPDKQMMVRLIFDKDKYNETKDIIFNPANLQDYVDNTKEKIIVYYDFETINTVISSVNGAFPYQQIPTQCSYIVVDKEGVEIEKNNLIIDPKKVDIKWLENVIEKLYHPDAIYVVYNAAFEKTVLKHISSRIAISQHHKNLILEINKATIDQMDVFTTHSVKKNSILIPEANGRYSIKIISKFVPKKIKEKAKYVSYEDLKIKNGGEALEMAKKRFYNSADLSLCGDEEWNSAVENLKKYCENDVRAMIAIQLYVEFIYNSTKKG